MEERLGGKHPVERIGMVPVEAASADGVGSVDVERLCSQPTNEGVVLSEQDLSFRPRAGARAPPATEAHQMTSGPTRAARSAADDHAPQRAGRGVRTWTRA